MRLVHHNFFAFISLTLPSPPSLQNKKEVEEEEERWNRHRCRHGAMEAALILF